MIPGNAPSLSSVALIHASIKAAGFAVQLKELIKVTTPRSWSILIIGSSHVLILLVSAHSLVKQRIAVHVRE